MHVWKEAWHYKIWKWTYDPGSIVDRAPKKTNLCRYVSRILFFAPLLGIGFGTIATGLIFMVIIVPNAVTIVLGFGTVQPWETKSFHPFPALRVAERRVPLYLIVCTAWLMAAIAAVTYFLPTLSSNATAYAVSGIVGIVALVLILYVLYFAGMATIDACSGWSGWRTMREYLRAKKQGFCPLVEFDDHRVPTVSD